MFPVPAHFRAKTLILFQLQEGNPVKDYIFICTHPCVGRIHTYFNVIGRMKNMSKDRVAIGGGISGE